MAFFKRSLLKLFQHPLQSMYNLSQRLTRARLFYLTLLFNQLDRLQYLLDAQTKHFNMGITNTKNENLEVFPIDTFIQNPGYDLISRNIFKYLKLKDFSNCCLVSKGWKRFIMQADIIMLWWSSSY